jgi:hypothetical protein
LSDLDYFAYRASAELTRDDPPFYALIAAAMRKADPVNLGLLKAAWPRVWSDLQRRYVAPGGILETDPASIREHVLERNPG